MVAQRRASLSDSGSTSSRHEPEAAVAERVRRPGAVFLYNLRDPDELGIDSRGVRWAFLQRMRTWIEDVAVTASEDVLADALANPSVRGGLVRLLSETAAVPESSEITRLREQALARGLAAKETLRERAGGFKPTAWVGEHLGITRQAVDKRRKAGKLLAIPSPDGTFAYPMCQFAADGVVPGLEAALAALEGEGPWERLSALVNPSPALDGRTVLDVLAGSSTHKEREQAVEVARHFLR